MIAIVDYGAGNLTSVRNAFAALGAETVATRDASVIEAADSVVFPGVGAAGKAMENLKSMGLVDAVVSAARNRRFLGICLGMQILFDRTDEDGGVDCLGVVGGRVRRFPGDAGVKIPQIFNAYNKRYTNGFYAGFKEYFITTSLSADGGRASQCVQ